MERKQKRIKSKTIQHIYKLTKIQSKQMKTKNLAIKAIGLGLVIMLIYSCTSSLFVVKGQNNKIKTEQNVNADSTSVSINNQK